MFVSLKSTFFLHEILVRRKEEAKKIRDFYNAHHVGAHH
ncbi:unnamed protein product [Ectocarpus fasciculatus]